MMTMKELEELERDIASTPDDRQVKLWAGTVRELVAMAKAFGKIALELRSPMMPRKDSASRS